MIIKDKDGKDIEVFTADEVAQREQTAATKASEEAAKKAVDEYKAQNPDKTQEVDQLKKDLEESTRKLREAEEADDGKDSSGQVKRLRDERNAAEKKLTDTVGDFTKKFDDLRKELIGDVKNELLAKLAAGNEELKKKIEFEFDNYRPNDNSKAGIVERMEKAYQLATGNRPTPGLLDNVSSNFSGKGQQHHNVDPKKEPTPNEVAIGNVLGITDEDRKKYRGKANSSTAN